VDIALPMHLHLAPLPAAPDVAALMFGPLVLAARMGGAGMTPGDDLIVNERTYGDVLALAASPPLPSLQLTGRSLDEVVRPSDGPFTFRVLADTSGVRELELIPYHRIAHERYSIYWQLA